MIRVLIQADRLWFRGQKLLQVGSYEGVFPIIKTSFIYMGLTCVQVDVSPFSIENAFSFSVKKAAPLHFRLGRLLPFVCYAIISML